MQHYNPDRPQTKPKKSIKKVQVARTKSVQRHLTTQNARDLNIFDSMTKRINQVSQNMTSLPLHNQFTANNVVCKNFGFGCGSNENLMLGLGG